MVVTPLFGELAHFGSEPFNVLHLICISLIKAGLALKLPTMQDTFGQYQVHAFTKNYLPTFDQVLRSLSPFYFNDLVDISVSIAKHTYEYNSGFCDITLSMKLQLAHRDLLHSFHLS